MNMLVAQNSVEMDLLGLFLIIIAVSYVVSVVFIVVKHIVQMRKWEKEYDRYVESAKSILKEKEIDAKTAKMAGK